jgi:hypothetical protein
MANNGATAAVTANPPVGPQQQKKVIAFRFATLERTSPLPNVVTALSYVTAGTQPNPFQIQADGLIYDLILDVASSAGDDQTTNAVYFEDAPYSILDSIGLKDPSSDLISTMGGFNLYLANLLQGNYRNTVVEASSLTSVNGETLGNPFAHASVAGGTALAYGSGLHNQGDLAGNFRFLLHVPVALNMKTLAGVLGNQNRAVVYTVSLNVAAGTGSTTGPVFTTAPAGGTSPTLTITPTYRSFTVPDATNAAGIQQQQLPSNYGTLHLLQANSNPSAPTTGSVTHYVTNLGTTTRSLTFVLRSVNNTGLASRNNSELATPTNIQLYWGSTAQFNESWSVRRAIMFERFGFHFPVGVISYDNISDGLVGAGMETGASYINTQALTNARFVANYPTVGNQWAAGSTLTQIMDSLKVVQPQAA